MWQIDIDKQRLKDFNDIERRVSTQIIEVLLAKVEKLTNQNRCMANILRRPRLTTQFHKEMMENQKTLQQTINIMNEADDKNYEDDEIKLTIPKVKERAPSIPIHRE